MKIKLEKAETTYQKIDRTFDFDVNGKKVRVFYTQYNDTENDESDTEIDVDGDELTEDEDEDFRDYLDEQNLNTYGNKN